MNELPPEARSVLDALRDAHDPTDTDRARVRAALARRLEAQATNPWRWRGPLAALAMVGAAAGWYALVRSPTEVPEALNSRPLAPTDAVGDGAMVQPRTIAADAMVQARTIVPAAASPTPAPPPEAPAPQATPAPAPVGTPPADPEAELRLLTAAHGRLQRGDGAGALAAVDTHRRRYPRGALREEREALRVRALCALHRETEARRVAARFLAAWPRSPQASRVRASCAGP